MSYRSHHPEPQAGMDGPVDAVGWCPTSRTHPPRRACARRGSSDLPHVDTHDYRESASHRAARSTTDRAVVRVVAPGSLRAMILEAEYGTPRAGIGRGFLTVTWQRSIICTRTCRDSGADPQDHCCRASITDVYAGTFVIPTRRESQATAVWIRRDGGPTL
jgi:hypothetical protein